MTAAQGYSLAIETSCRKGSITLGLGDEQLVTIELPEQRRHAVELLPVMDRCCRQRGLNPSDIREVYVSVGPGSFTGLRIGLTVAKVVCHVTGAALVAVPTLSVVAANAPPQCARVAVMLNAKGGRCFTGLFESGEPLIEPCLMTPVELCRVHDGVLIGDHLPEHDWPASIRLLDPLLAVPSSRHVWRIGRELSARGLFTTPLELIPMYVRLPEAEEVWRAKQVVSDGVVPSLTH